MNTIIVNLSTTCGNMVVTEHTSALNTAITVPISAEQPNMSKNFPIDFNNTMPVPSSVALA